MKYLVLSAVFGLGYLAATVANPLAAGQKQTAQPPAAKPAPPANPAIDMEGYLKGAQEAAKHREERRLTEDDFIKMSKEPGTIVLDARSKEMYDLLHVKGAINLSFPDIDIESLKKVLPDKTARILIYCNNNFTDPKAAKAADAVTPNGGIPRATLNARARAAFQPKSAVASLNLSTYIALHGYGYKNVYELAPLVEPEKSKLAFESTPKK